MPGTRKKPTSKLVFEDGHYYIVVGTKKIDAGISKRYAEKLLREMYP